MSRLEFLVWRQRKKKELLNWKQNEIDKAREKEHGLNFTCLQTPDEAQADLNLELEEWKQENIDLGLANEWL